MKRTIEPGESTDDCGNRINNSTGTSIDCSVVFKGKNCSLTVGIGSRITGCNFIFNSDNGEISLGEAVIMLATFEVGIDSIIEIGSRTTNTRHSYFSAAEGTSVVVGENCMFSSDNEVRSDDSHPIFDATTGNRINPSRSITIGSNVWIAKRSVILSGSSVGSGSVIGFGSIVKGDIPSCVVASGNPARIIKTGIKWSRDHVSKHAPYLYEHISKSSRVLK